jgi:hypothetical protein
MSAFEWFLVIFYSPIIFFVGLLALVLAIKVALIAILLAVAVVAYTVAVPVGILIVIVTSIQKAIGR